MRLPRLFVRTPKIYPNFLVIGGQKCGTTWLYHYLRSHPGVFVPPTLKELTYFDNYERYHSLGDSGYRKFFECAGDKRAIGEVTPTYLWVAQNHPEWGAPDDFRAMTPVRIRKLLGPRLRLIVLLRNPVERTVSAFLHHTKMQRIDRGAPIRQWLESFGILHMGFWNAHLSRWADVYPHENFFVATYENLFSNSDCLEQLLAFIGVPPHKGLAGRKGVRFQESFPYVREGDRFRYEDGTMICGEQDTEIIRSIFDDDVSELSKNWTLHGDAWVNEFKT